ncbi:sugar phosphate isomerase/epimerase family protein [Candidatus Latescibacterota bacterium]
MMYVGSYDAPVRDLASYALRLQELVHLGFHSVGLAISWDEHPRDLSAEDRQAVADLVREHELELRFHPDLANVARASVQHNRELLACAADELEPIVAWAVELGVVSLCCDSLRQQLDETIDVFSLLVDMTRGTALQLGVENSQRGIINSPERLNEVVDRVGDPRMGVLLDVGHVNTTVTQQWNDCPSPQDFVTGLRVPIWDTHLHTNGGVTDDHLPVSNPAGTLDLGQVLAGLDQVGYAGPLNLECSRKNCPGSLRDMETAMLADRQLLEGIVAQVVR